MPDGESIIASDGDTYTLTDEYPGIYTREDDSGTRFFAERLPDQSDGGPPQGIYRTHPREEMLARAKLKSEVSCRKFTTLGVKISRASFQAYKKYNEDRSFAYEFQEGILFGVLDGHWGRHLSDHTAKSLPPLLASAIVAELQTSPPEKAIPSALSRTIIEYDDSILNDVLKEFDLETTPPAEWEPWYVCRTFGLRKDEGLPGNRYEIPRRAVVGTTALIAYLSKTGKDIWIANLGDSEGFCGRLSDDKQHWMATTLNDLHNARDPAEVARLKDAHPGEEVIKHGRLLGPCRSLVLKVDPDIGFHILACAGAPSPVIPSAFDCWRVHHRTPPYMSSTPSIRHYPLRPDEVVVLATDGVANMHGLTDLTAEERSFLLLSLAGAHTAAQPTEPWSLRLKHEFIPPNQGDSAAERTIRNLLFGMDDRKLARETCMEHPDPEAIMYGLRDDITIVVVERSCAGS